MLTDGSAPGPKLNGRDEEGFTPRMRSHRRAAVAMHIGDEARATGHNIRNVLLSHTLDDASEALGVSRSTVKRMRKRLGIAGPVQV